jgi:hypothetical protein
MWHSVVNISVVVTEAGATTVVSATVIVEGGTMTMRRLTPIRMMREMCPQRFLNITTEIVAYNASNSTITSQSSSSGHGGQSGGQFGHADMIDWCPQRRRELTQWRWGIVL